MKTPRTAKHILRELVDKWLFYPLITSNRTKTDAGTYRPTGKPGEAIERLSPEERELLKELKAEDLKHDRWPLYDGWFGDKEKK